MIYLESNSTSPYFNFALEHYIVQHLLPQKSICMLWRTKPSVMIGKYQNTWAEINHDFVKKHKINVVRRPSGGGTIYTDLGGYQFTFIKKNQGEKIDFSQYIQPILAALHELGIQEASASGRNDLVIAGKKFSGNAQYVQNGYTVHHGSLLFDTKIENIVKSTTVDSYKIISKGIKSVRDRVCNIKDYLDQDIEPEEFKRIMIKNIMGQEDYPEYKLSELERAKIEEIALAKFDNYEAKYSKDLEANIEKCKYFAGGKVSAQILVKAGKILDLSLTGDFFGTLLIQDLENALIGCSYEEETIQEVLAQFKVEDTLYKISEAELLSVLI